MKFIIIPARAGSKGLLNKNLQRVGGISLVEWSIIHGLYVADDGDKVIVSSDSQKILKSVANTGVETVLRPESLSQDTTPTLPVLEHALQHFKPADGDIIILLQPTSPLRKKTTLDISLKAVVSGDGESSITVKPNHLFLWEEIDGFIKPKYQDDMRRQDMKPQLSENGSIYVTKYRHFKEKGIKITNKIKPIITEGSENIDVDTKFDLDMANYFSSEYLKEWQI